MACNITVAPNEKEPWTHYMYPTCNHIYDKTTGKRLTIDKLRATNTTRWNRALSNEWGRLAQGNDHGVVAQDAIDFILVHEVPSGRAVTYAQFVCDHCPL